MSEAGLLARKKMLKPTDAVKMIANTTMAVVLDDFFSGFICYVLGGCAAIGVVAAVAVVVTERSGALMPGRLGCFR